MTGALAAIQAVLLAVVLAWSGRLKLADRSTRLRAAEGALGKLVGKGRAPLVYGAVGVVEIAIAALLLGGGLAGTVPALDTLPQFAAASAAVLSVGFLGYLGYVRLFAPTSSCGCVSARQSPVRARSFARAGMMLAAAMLSLLVGDSWVTGLTAHPVGCVALVVAELVAVVLLSPEADRSWLLPLRRLRARFRPHPLAGMAFDLPLASTLRQLQRSTAYQQVGALLRSDVIDSWDSDEWRIVCYHARHGGAEKTAVFAVPRLRYEPDAVKVVFVDEEAGHGSVDPGPVALAPA